MKTKIVSVSQGDYYGKYLNSPSATKAGTWDISEPGWVADWYGNNGRSFIAVLFDGRKYGPNTVNYGDYNSSKVNALIDQAESAPTEAQAAPFWAQADKQIMTDAAFIPFQTQKVPVFHSGPGEERDVVAVRPVVRRDEPLAQPDQRERHRSGRRARRRRGRHLRRAQHPGIGLDPPPPGPGGHDLAWESWSPSWSSRSPLR